MHRRCKTYCAEQAGKGGMERGGSYQKKSESARPVHQAKQFGWEGRRGVAPVEKGKRAISRGA